jgi:hypothetical protein
MIEEREPVWKRCGLVHPNEYARTVLDMHWMQLITLGGIPEEVDSRSMKSTTDYFLRGIGRTTRIVCDAISWAEHSPGSTESIIYCAESEVDRIEAIVIALMAESESTAKEGSVIVKCTDGSVSPWRVHFFDNSWEGDD